MTQTETAETSLAWIAHQLCREATHYQQDDGTMLTIVPYAWMLRLERFLDDYDAGRHPVAWRRIHDQPKTH